MGSAGLVYWAQKNQLTEIKINLEQSLEQQNITINYSAEEQQTLVPLQAIEAIYELNKTTHWSDYADPVMSIIITCIILISTWQLFIESAKIVLQISPDQLDPRAVKNFLI